MKQNMFEIWVEKWRPRKIEDCVLTKELKNTFQTFVDSDQIPNLLLVGPPGTGKTTVAKAMLETLGHNYIFINSSLDRSIDMLRNQIDQFASSVSFTGGRKYVILDEADNLREDFQKALRSFIETYSSNCGFILTANYKHKLIEPLWSRLAIIEFDTSKKSAPVLGKEFMHRVGHILDEEKIPYDKNVVAKMIMKYYPDWRRVLNELQKYAIVEKKIDDGIFENLQRTSIKELIAYMKEKNFSSVRKWVGENSSDGIFRVFYDEAVEYFSPAYIPELVIILGKYQYQAAFVTDPEINVAAFCVEVMLGAIYK